MVVGKDFTPAKISDVQIDSQQLLLMDLEKMILLTRLMKNKFKALLKFQLL